MILLVGLWLFLGLRVLLLLLLLPLLLRPSLLVLLILGVLLLILLVLLVLLRVLWVRVRILLLLLLWVLLVLLVLWVLLVRLLTALAVGTMRSCILSLISRLLSVVGQLRGGCREAFSGGGVVTAVSVHLVVDGLGLWFADELIVDVEHFRDRGGPRDDVVELVLGR